MENLLTSTEIFDTETEMWSEGPELPSPLAFATVVSTPLATFILGKSKNIRVTGYVQS